MGKEMGMLGILSAADGYGRRRLGPSGDQGV